MRTDQPKGRGTGAKALPQPWVVPGWGGAARLGSALGRGPAWVAGCVAREVEQRRLFPWIAVAYGIGIAGAFAADGPLSPWPPLLVATAFGAGAVFARARPVLLALLIGAAAIFAGFAVAVLRMEAVAAPVLSRTVIAPMEGFVETIEERPAGGRLVIRLMKLDRVEAAARPERVRVSARSLDGVRPGDYVAGTARLLPPPEAARPGGYDFARDAYFRGIGAVGSVSGRLRRVEPSPVAQPWTLAAASLVDRARNVMTARIAGAIGGQAGAVAAALVTGKRGLIEDRTNDILRAAGIYHVVSISGLHMMLAAGVFFWLTRALLALSPAVALRWPIKKIAALVGMAGATAYCVFSGADVAAERSLLMILVMQGAILFDRPALSMRNLALSALIVLTREPETLLGPSLQMSYAAVAGLIALAEWNRHRRPEEGDDVLKRAARWVAALVIGTVATTLAATVATAPFSSYHFNNLQPYGIIGNAATLPLVSFVIMPGAVLGTLAYPFGLDRPVWWAMGLGVEAMLKLSAWVAGLGGSTVTVPAFGAGALLLLILALLVATLFVSGLRWFALAPAALGMLAASATSRPDIYVARDGSGAAVRGADGRLVLLGRVPAFTAEQWLKADGDKRRATDPTLRAGTQCDPVGCTIRLPDGRAVSFLEDRRGFPEDCRRAAAILSRFTAPPSCGAALVVDRNALAAGGAVAARASPDGFEVTTARRPDDTRPWLRKPSSTEAVIRSGAAARDTQAPPRSSPRIAPDAEPPVTADTDLAPAESPDGDPGP